TRLAATLLRANHSIMPFTSHLPCPHRSGRREECHRQRRRERVILHPTVLHARRSWRSACPCSPRRRQMAALPEVAVGGVVSGR
ncbi:MAG: hypothetical protein OXG82_20725, partial [Gammaproteobacteria bacterium]|nr:hypothetical protein [Gammaproteobacteria bacterium]